MVLFLSSPLTLTCSLFMCRFGEDVFYVAWCITRHTEAWTTVHTWPNIIMTTQLLDASVICAVVWWDSGKRTNLSSDGDFSSPWQGGTELFHLKVHAPATYSSLCAKGRKSFLMFFIFKGAHLLFMLLKDSASTSLVEVRAPCLSFCCWIPNSLWIWSESGTSMLSLFSRIRRAHTMMFVQSFFQPLWKSCGWCLVQHKVCLTPVPHLKY